MKIKRFLNWFFIALTCVLAPLAIYTYMLTVRDSDAQAITMAVYQKAKELDILAPLSPSLPPDEREHLVQSMRFGRKQDTEIIILGLSENEIGQFVRVDKVQPTAITIANPRQLGYDHSGTLDGDFFVEITGIPTLPNPQRSLWWSTTLQTHQRTIAVRGFSCYGIVLANNKGFYPLSRYKSSERVYQQMRSFSETYLLLALPEKDFQVRASWAMLKPSPIYQAHFFDETGQWVFSYAYYENAEDVQQAQLLLWDNQGYLIPSPRVKFMR